MLDLVLAYFLSQQIHVEYFRVCVCVCVFYLFFGVLFFLNCCSITVVCIFSPPFHPIPLLGLYSKNPETPIQKNLCIPMFIAAQFTMAKYWKQPKCPSANEWIKKHVEYFLNVSFTDLNALCNSLVEERY